MNFHIKIDTFEVVRELARFYFRNPQKTCSKGLQSHFTTFKKSSTSIPAFLSWDFNKYGATSLCKGMESGQTI